MSNVVNFDRQQRLDKQALQQQRKIAEHAIDRAKEEWKRLAQMEQQQR
jgi:thymidylate synthase ThyX